MKKICIFCSLPSFNTGMPISTYKLAVGLVGKEGIEVCAILPDEGEFADRLRGIGVDVRVIPFQRVRRKFLLMPRILKTWVTAGLRLRKFICSHGIDIVHFSDVIDAPYYVWARAAGAKTVAHVRVCVDNPVARYLYRVWTNIFCSRIITVSKFVKRYYRFGKRASVVYNPGPDRTIFDTNLYRKTPRRGGILPPANGVDAHGIDTANGRIATDIPTVIAVSSFRRDKGLHNFIRIAARMRELFNGEISFVIVGGKVSGHEGYHEEVMELVKRIGLDGYLTVTGNVRHEEVPAIMSKASVLVHAPDWDEALGGVVLEAMAMGVAVVAYGCGGVGECFTDGKSGYLVKRGDIDGAAQVGVSLLTSCELRNKVAGEAQKELDKKFTLDLYVDNVLNVYAAV